VGGAGEGRAVVLWEAVAAAAAAAGGGGGVRWRWRGGGGAGKPTTRCASRLAWQVWAWAKLAGLAKLNSSASPARPLRQCA
jgi:hypothetical protein